MSALPRDVCRCHDSACPEREMCRRWLSRDVAGMAVRAASMWPFRVPLKQDCPHRIAPEGTQPPVEVPEFFRKVFGG